MGLIAHITVLIFTGIVTLAAFIFVVIDMFGRVDYLKDKAPSLERILAKRSAVSALLLVTIFLLVGSAFELLTKEMPEPPAPIVQIKAPLAPQLQIVSGRQPIRAAIDKSGPLDRFLNAEQKEHLFKELKRIATDPRQKRYITVTIAAAYPHDRESSRLTMQLIGVFQDAGWNVVGQQAPNYEQPFQGQLPIGIWVSESASNNMALFIEGNLINVGLYAELRQGPQIKLASDFKGALVLIGYKGGPF